MNWLLSNARENIKKLCFACEWLIDCSIETHTVKYCSFLQRSLSKKRKWETNKLNYVRFTRKNPYNNLTKIMCKILEVQTKIEFMDKSCKFHKIAIDCSKT